MRISDWSSDVCSSDLFAGGYPFRERKHPMPIGTVKFFNTDKGYGFIENEDGSGDSFVHITAVQSAGMQTLNKDQRLSYDLETGSNGKISAINLQRPEEHTSELPSLTRNS